MHYYQFNMHCNQFNKHYIWFPKLPAQTWNPNQLHWRTNVPEDTEYNFVYTVSHCLTTVVITLFTATSFRLFDHINEIHLPTAHTRGGSDKRSCLAKYGTWMGMCHILNEPPATVKRRKPSKLCIFTAVYDDHIKHKFSPKNGSAVLNYLTSHFETSETSYMS